MTYSVTQLVTEAYYITSIVSRRLQTVTGNQLTDGVNSLNDLLTTKSFNKSLIPYFSYTTLPLIVGQEAYSVDNLISLENVTFNLGTVRFSMMEASRSRYFATPRVDNINSLPYMWHFEREKGGGVIYVYFKPSQTFPLKFNGKYGFDTVTKDTDLEDVYDRFYISYLKYALAKYLCINYAISMQPDALRQLAEYEEQLRYVSPIDFSTNIRNPMQKGYPDMYAQANLGKGWTT